MILLADSGSTKTHWVLMEQKLVKTSVETAGLNPYFVESETIESILRADLVPHLPADFVQEIHFYGAGCSTENNNARIADCLKIFFRKAKIHIYHDILGAARALFGDRPGISCILGTGCNSCWYDGRVPFSKVPSLGYLYGDEGAGSYLGKQLIGHYLKDSLPLDLKKEFDKTYHFALEDILNAIYNRPFPNRFLASFSRFIAPRQDHPFLQRMIRTSFDAFFEAQVKRYDNYRNTPVSFVGSIAHIYRKILLESAAEAGVNVETILCSPMDGLIAYHSGSSK
jgi:glucosamine kinase